MELRLARSERLFPRALPELPMNKAYAACIVGQIIRADNQTMLLCGRTAVARLPPQMAFGPAARKPAGALATRRVQAVACVLLDSLTDDGQSARPIRRR